MTVPPAQAPAAKPFGPRFVSPLMLGSALNPINSSMLATALVGIGADLGVGTGTTALLISVLYLSSAVSQPTMGKISTLVGPRRTFLGGLVVLFAGGVVGAAAPSFGFLLVSRALIGIGTSACYPTAMALIRQRADATRSGVPTSVLGNLSIASQITAMFGLPLGGVLVGAFSWRAIFAVNIPLALLAIVLTVVGVPRDRPRPREEGEGVLRALDLPGIVLFAGTIVSLLVFLAHLASPVWWLVALVAVLGVGLVLWERRAASPLIDVRMLARNGPLARTYLRSGLVNLGNYAALNGLSQWMEQSRGLSATAVGLVLIPLTAFAVVISRVISRRGTLRVPLLVGGAAQGLAGLALLAVTRDTPVVLLVGTTFLLSCYAFGSIANQAALYLQSPGDQIAVASGLFRTSGYVGAIFSSSLIALAYGAKATDAGLHHLGWGLVVIGVLIVLVVAPDRSIPRRVS